MKTLDQFKKDIVKYELKTSIADDFESLYRGLIYANGCGAKGGTQFPHTMYFVDIESACVIHDIEWMLSKSKEDLLEANENLDDNLKKICDKESNSIMRWFRRMRIAKYVAAVELVGTIAYTKERNLV